MRRLGLGSRSARGRGQRRSEGLQTDGGRLLWLLLAFGLCLRRGFLRRSRLPGGLLAGRDPLQVGGQIGASRRRREGVKDRLEVSQQIRSVGVALRRLPREGLHQDRVERRGDVRIHAGSRRDTRRAHLLEHGELGVAAEKLLPRQHLEEDATEGEDVASPVQRPSPGLLRRHIRDLSLQGARLGARDLPGRLRDAEVAQFDVALVGDQDVGGRHVAVDDVQLAPLPLAPAVRVIERRGDLRGDEDGERRRQRQAGLASRVQDRAQVASLDVLHRDEVPAGLDLSEVEDVHDIGVIELGGELGLVGEHRDELFVVGDVRQDLLDRHDLLEALDTAPAGLEDLGHSPGVDPLEDLVLPETVRPRHGDRRGRLRNARGRRRGRGNGNGGSGRPRTRGDLHRRQRLGEELLDRRVRPARRRGDGRRPLRGSGDGRRRRLRCPRAAGRGSLAEHPGQRVAEPAIDLVLGSSRRLRGSRRRRLASELLQDFREDVRGRQRGRLAEFGSRDPRRPARIGEVRRRGDSGPQLLVGKRPDQNLERSDLLGVRLGVGASVAGHHQDDGRRHRAPAAPDLPDDLGARQARQHARQEHEIEAPGGIDLEALFPVARLDNLVSGGQQRAQTLQRAGVILDQEQLFRHSSECCARERPLNCKAFGALPAHI